MNRMNRPPRAARPSLPQRPEPRRESAAARPSRPGQGAVFCEVLVWALVGLLVVRWDWAGIGHRSIQVGESYGSSVVWRIGKLTLLALGATVILRQFARARMVIRRTDAMFLFFLVLAPLSVLWSISPWDTLGRSASVVSIVSVALAFVLVGWHRRRFQDVLGRIITAILIGSLVLGMLMPEWVIEKGEGTLKDAWHGLLNSKNGFGQAAAFGVILWIHAWLFEKRSWWRVLPWFATAVICLLFSRSSTSMLSTIFSVMLMSLLYRLPREMRRYNGLIVAFFVMIVIVYGMSVLNFLPAQNLLFGPISALTGKDTTFSNRSEIWKIIEDHIALSPVIGSGYGGYWIGPSVNSPSIQFIGSMGFYPHESHNGYLEITNDLGFLGLACLLGYLFIFIKQCLELIKLDRSQAVLFLCLFFQQALINLSESTWLDVDAAYGFIVMTIATFALARMRLDASLQLRSAPGARNARN